MRGGGEYKKTFSGRDVPLYPRVGRDSSGVLNPEVTLTVVQTSRYTADGPGGPCVTGDSTAGPWGASPALRARGPEVGEVADSEVLGPE